MSHQIDTAGKLRVTLPPSDTALVGIRGLVGVLSGIPAKIEQITRVVILRYHLLAIWPARLPQPTWLHNISSSSKKERIPRLATLNGIAKMKILALHGIGSSGTILNEQLRPILEELGPNHHVSYLDGSIPSKRGPGIVASASSPHERDF